MSVDRRTPADFAGVIWRTLATADHVTIWDWAITHGRIPEMESKRDPRWNPRKARMMRIPLELAHARLTGNELPWRRYAEAIEEIIVCGPSQGGKTKSFNHPILCYAIDVLRSHVALATHKQRQIRDHLRIRLLPMLEITPRLARYLPPASLRKERLSGQTWLLEGVRMRAICGNVASDLREYSERVIIGEEIEAWAQDVDGEGNPIELAIDRMKEHGFDSLFAASSTPAMITGHTWSRLCQGSHERLLLRCQHCGHDQDLDPDQLRCTRDGATPEEIKHHDLACWYCRHCGGPHTSADKDRLIDEAIAAHRVVPGTWAQTDEHPAGIWIPGTYWRPVISDDPDAEIRHEAVPCAHWSSEGERQQHQLQDVDWPMLRAATWKLNYLHDSGCSCGLFLAHERRTRAGSAQQLCSHVNQWLAEPLLATQATLSVDDVLQHQQNPFAWSQSPEHPAFLVCIADQQGNTTARMWFPYEIRAMLPGRSYHVESGEVRGLDGLRQLEERVWLCGGRGRRLDKTFVDGANGNVARAMRDWALESYAELRARGLAHEDARRQTRRILLVGDVNLAEDIPWKERQPNKRDQIHHPPGVRIFRWNRLYWSDHFHDRLLAKAGRPRYHIPTADPERPKALLRTLKSYTSEERVITPVGMPGGRKRLMVVWRPCTYTDPAGKEVTRSDTHWWVSGIMGDVAEDLLGVHRGAAAPQPDPSPGTTTPAPPAKDATPPKRPRQQRKHSRLRRR